IANVNTPGFKVGRVRFQDILNQTLRGASGAQDGRAGTNPMQIGLGVVVGGVDTVQTQGALQSTGKMSDLAIQGDGFFAVSDGNQLLFTRDGAFDIGVDGKLANLATGFYVLGWQADKDGNVDPTQPLGQIQIPLGQQLDATASTAIRLQGNLDANAAAGDSYQTKVNVVDSLGFTHELTLTFTKTGSNTWDWAYSTTDPAVTLGGGASGTATFDANGNYVAPGTPNPDLSITFTNGADTMTIAQGGDFNLLTQLNSESSATATANGSKAGALTSFSVGETGEIVGLYSNGTTKTLGQIATATFANPGGLMKTGSNMYSASANSGDPMYAQPGSSGHGTIAGGYLEGSNVDLAEEFTNMIRAERGFQANSRVITTSDEILQDLVNIKR
ncbi:MAG: flagellar hook protein FlgE, partial [Thermomicrobiaceae bacterium]|nr:flagellar hook protein FlgE [Thermomicrobiaceae bacterium]